MIAEGKIALILALGRARRGIVANGIWTRRPSRPIVSRVSEEIKPVTS